MSSPLVYRKSGDRVWTVAADVENEMPKTVEPPKRSGRPLLGFEGAAQYTGFSERYLRRLVAERRIPHVKMGEGRTSPIRFDPDKLDEWITSLNVDPAA